MEDSAMQRLARLTVSTALAAAAVALFGGSALAASPVSDLVRTSRDHTTSTNWSGYAAYNSTFSDVKGSFTVPQSSCSGLKRNQVTIASPWVGLDGYLSNTVEQAGTDSDCIGSTRTQYVAWYEFYPAGTVNLSSSTYPVSPGDNMTTEVAHAGSSVTVTLQNTTRNWTFSTSQSASGLAFSSAEWIMEAPTQTLTNYGTASFANAAATDATHTNGAISDFTNDKMTMVSKNGRTVRSRPSDLTSGGTAFTVTWLHG
jgi:hypothetical protein